MWSTNLGIRVTESDPAARAPLTVVSIWNNRVDGVRQSIASILAQCREGDRCLIVDDGSTDGTLDALRAVVADLTSIDAEVLSWANMGFTHALVQATRRVETEYFALHGAGDVCAPNRLAVQLDHAERSGAVVIGCAVGSVDASGRMSSTERLPRDVPRGQAQPHRPPRPGTHGAALIRTAAFQAAGGYRPEFRYSQDADLWFRMSALGDFSGVTELLYWKYRGVGETVSSDPSKRFLQALYGELARQCEEDRSAGRSDLVERFGHDAVMFLRDTPRLQKRLIRSGIDSIDLALMRGLLQDEDPRGDDADASLVYGTLSRLRRMLQ